MKKILNTLLLVLCISANAYSQWNIDHMSEFRSELQSARVGNEIYLIGGKNNLGTTDLVEIYNTTTNTWMPPAYLSSARSLAAAVSGDSALYVAGGVTDTNVPLVGTNIVDIYKNGAWTTYLLPDSFYSTQAVHAGSKIIFGGSIKKFDTVTNLPEPGNTIYILDELTGTWSMAALSQARFGTATATNGTIVMFAGGFTGFNEPSNRIDIYNSVTNTWTIDSLSEARGFAAGVFAGGKFYFAGGCNALTGSSSSTIDIFDGSAWITAQLSVPRAGITTTAAGTKILFAGGADFDPAHTSGINSTNVADVFDYYNNTWSVMNMNFDKVNHTAISVGTKVYIAGGLSINHIACSLLDVVEIFDVTTGIFSVEPYTGGNIYPNPVTTSANFDFGRNIVNGTLKIFDRLGRIVKEKNNLNGKQTTFETFGLSGGTYFFAVNENNSVVCSGKFIIN